MTKVITEPTRVTITEPRVRMVDVALYNGPLEELNSRGSQYKFASEQRFVSSPSSDEQFILEEIARRGYDGLVNVRTTYVNRSTMHSDIRTVIEGTPILLN